MLGGFIPELSKKTAPKLVGLRLPTHPFLLLRVKEVRAKLGKNLLGEGKGRRGFLQTFWAGVLAVRVLGGDRRVFVFPVGTAEQQLLVV